MKELRISFSSQKNKQLELSQLLNSLVPDLEKSGTTVQITENQNRFTVFIRTGSMQKLKEVLRSKEIRILSGSIGLLGQKLKVSGQGKQYRTTGSDLTSIRLEEE